ncbi:MAG: hypothetical protein ABIU05_00555, partial [Nitrospirales bacterium]
PVLGGPGGEIPLGYSTFSLLDLYRFYLLLPRGRGRWSPTVPVQRGASSLLLHRPSWGWPRLPSTARVERAHSDRARSASKEGTWRSPSHLPKRPLKGLFRLFHVLFNIRLQMPRSCLPIIFRVADAVVRKMNSSESGSGSTKSSALARTMRCLISARSIL